MKQLYTYLLAGPALLIVLLLFFPFNLQAQGNDPFSTEALRAAHRNLRDKHLRPVTNNAANQQDWQRAQQKYGKARDSLLNAVLSRQQERSMLEQQAKDREEMNTLQLMSITSTGEGLIPDAVERQSLVDIYNATNGAGWWNSTNWLVGNTNADFGTWYGVTVSNGDIVSLNLSQNNLNGSIPASIGNITGLSHLYLHNNSLTGQIPASIGYLASLQMLYLYNTQLSGMIPAELGQLTSLQKIYLQNNQLTGQIPSTLGNLAALKTLYLTRNQLSGLIPGTLGNLTALLELGLDNNSLSGPIPPQLGNLTAVQTLYMHNNALTGAIPPQLSGMGTVSRLYMHNNMLSGSIPPELGNLTNLQELGIGGNNLSGPIPATFANLTRLSQLYANNSNLSGPIPAFLGSYSSALYLYLDQNQFTGEIPAVLGNLPHLVDLSVWGNQLSGAVPASLASLPSLEYLSLEGNSISSIPNFQNAPRHFTLYVHTNGNKLDFGSIEPNMNGAATSAVAGFYYTDQALLGNPRTVGLTIGQPLELSFVTGGTRNQYQWQKQVNGAWQDLAGATAATYTVALGAASDKGIYRCRITNAWATALTLYTHEMTVVESTAQNINHIIVTSLQDAYQVMPDLQSLAPEKWQQQVTYFDGLGRPIQEVQRHSSPTGKDLVTPVSYDALGRVEKTYLPYVEGSDGSYKADALGIPGQADSYTSGRQYQFYQSSLDKHATDTAPYAVPVYESSPLNRVLEQGAPGTAWQPGTGRTVKVRQRTNTANEVRLWHYEETTREVVSKAPNTRGGTAISFDGYDDYVQVGDKSQLRMSNTLTLEAWIYPTSATENVIISKEGEYVVSRFGDGTIRWGFSNTNPGWNWVNTSAVTQLNTWTHVAVTYDAGVVKTYLNGVLQHTYNGSGAVGDAYANLNDFRIGTSQAWGTPYSGFMDEVRVWNTVRTQQQISTGMDQGITVPAAGLVGYWRFNEGSGTTTADASGNAYTGTLMNGAVWEAFVVASATNTRGGTAISFDGYDDYVQVGDKSHLQLSNTFTLEAWIYPDGNVHGIIINKEGEYEVARFPDGTIRWAFANTNPGWNWLNTGVVAPLGVWSHVAITYDAGVVITYLNGTLVHTYNGSGVIGDVNESYNDFRIGGRQAAVEIFKGAIDEVRVWNVVRTQDELITNKGQLLQAPVPGLVGYWRLNEGSATITADASGNAYTGTLMNGAVWAISPFYAPGQLYVSEARDEHDALVVEYKDKQGRVVMKKVQEAATVADSETAAGFMVTQYAYDDKGQLRMVIQPEGSKLVPATGQWSTTTDPGFIANWCFRYDYDGQGRMIRKQVPGAGPVEIIYNKRDQVVLTQDAEQQGKNGWSFIKYDALNRPVLTGTTVISGKTRADIEGELNAETVHFEIDDLVTGIGYTLTNAYPRNVTDADLLTITYYDKYTYTALDGYSFTGDVANRAAAVRGLVTGTRVRSMEWPVIGPWLTSVNYYDKEYRPLESISDNHLDGRDRMVSVYDFAGKVLQTTHTHGKGNAALRTIVNTYDYDHAGRLLATTQQMESDSPVLLSRNKYNELGQLVDKKLHATTYDPVTKQGSFLQSVDYRYNIRGWLTSINNATLTQDSRNDDTGDLFGMELSYNTVSSRSYRHGENSVAATASGFFNGNISEVAWKSQGDGVQRAYSYGYDHAGRLLKADYHTEAGGTENYALWGMGYDANGNITGMSRKGLTSVPGAARTYGTMDELTYSYGLGTAKSNRLLGVDDASTTAAAHDFEDKNGRKYSAGAEYGYDLNGNMTRDDNKGISQVFYNHLNLPYRVEMGSPSDRIVYTYSSAGQKLRKQVFQNNNLVKTTDYAGMYVYENSVVQFAHTSEGRVLHEPGNTNKWRYEYHLKDHLGNLRVSFTQPALSEQLATMELMAAPEEEEHFENLPQTRHQDRARARTGAHAALLSSGRGRPLGPSRRVTLHKGDSLRAEAYGMYETEVRQSKVFSLLAWLASSAAVTAGTTGEGGKAENGLPYLGVGLALAPQVLQQEKEVPSAYIRYIVYDSDSNYVTSGYQSLSKAANRGWEAVQVGYVAEADGFAEVYLANESTEEVWFDDMSVTVAQPMLVQENHYDPWGLNLVGIEREGAPDHKFQYNGKEKQDDFFDSNGNGRRDNGELGLDWMDYGARMYDAQIGRWHVVDPMTETQESWTPYHYVYNNPVLRTDPDGRCPDGDCPTISVAGIIENTAKDLAVSFMNVAFMTESPVAAIANGGQTRAYRDENGTIQIGKRSLPSSVGELAANVGTDLLDAANVATTITTGGAGGAGLLMAKTGAKVAVNEVVQKGKGATTLKEQAIKVKNELNGGKNSVTIKTAKGQTRYDLDGKDHAGEATPHKQKYKNNVVNGEVKSITRESKRAESMNQQDLRTVLRYLNKKE